MNFLRLVLPWDLRSAARYLFLCGSILLTLTICQAQTASTNKKTGKPAHKSYPPDLIESGASTFQQSCAFCHGKDAGGGESGPDLTRSKLVFEVTSASGHAVVTVETSAKIDLGDLLKNSSLIPPHG